MSSSVQFGNKKRDILILGKVQHKNRMILHLQQNLNIKLVSEDQIENFL